ncbi:MAG: MaoC family dehydratase [Chloroflexi bacterium]|nr:MaoC family dehydratase [Chloroflexota bacterium]
MWFPGKRYEELKIGDKGVMSKTISESEVHIFAGMTGDLHPLHINAEYAKTTPYGQRLVHGVFTTGLISAATAICTGAPPGGYLLVGMNLRYTAPVFMGDTITATVEVVEKQDNKQLVHFQATATNQRGEVVVRGDVYEKKG